ncbi:hypothetical protein [Altericroceibacterium spongiae]|nr:hypothetical protein [Altericroceibacterium spongiae]
MNEINEALLFNALLHLPGREEKTPLLPYGTVDSTGREAGRAKRSET